MTLVLTVSCDGWWGTDTDNPMRCRGALPATVPDGPLGEVVYAAGQAALAAGWSITGPDLCPAHVKAMAAR